jgi:hypothetical protein
VRTDPAARLRTSLVARPRLIGQLNKGLPRRLTLISAPAGFGKTTLASSWLQHVNLPAASAERVGSLIEILILQAITFAAQHRDEALTALEQALRPAEPEGFVRVFLDEGAPMVELLRRAVAEGVHAPYALHLLNALGQVVAKPQPLIEPLVGVTMKSHQSAEASIVKVDVLGFIDTSLATPPNTSFDCFRSHASVVHCNYLNNDCK